MIDLQGLELRKGLCPATICHREDHTRAVRKSLWLNQIAVVMREGCFKEEEVPLVQLSREL